METNYIIEELKLKGFFKIPQVFSQIQINAIKQQVSRYVTKKHPGIVFEEDQKSIRGIHGLHLFDKFFCNLSRHPILLKLAMEHLGEPCYVHQYKVNLKKKHTGQAWPWHQDFIFWKHGDGIETPRLINIGVFLDRVTSDSGPLCLIPGSHLLGELTDIELSAGAWEQDVAAQLRYTISEQRALMLVEHYGRKYITGNAGDVIVFDPQTVHRSSLNLSDKDRQLLLITYNAISNRPFKESNRPEFLSAKGTKALEVNEFSETV
ncbi:phytanoyl-CoA dioxygenase family protein [Pseudoalteromonas aurantia]|uniref:Ectoine hydroxylase family protein n=1 Tax=Pseudoalteromonas aurantia TaxID=43654 RepID=A0A5S3VCP9_9GAMM|nr:phytanoyl-CoA dioxygenase family protein [Pseudoalteromonas aurantia]TMO68933.1 ectoine hydroxylase family protein [Pseudoalteromonas aurantia]TMO69891.1 ectoine hydroxylase family protein [Pseudoalteromonas aurantia]